MSLRAKIDAKISGRAPLYEALLEAYDKTTLVIGLQYISDHEKLLWVRIGQSSSELKASKAVLDAAWKWFELDLETHFGERPLGERRNSGNWEDLGVGQLRYRLLSEADLAEQRERVCTRKEV
jgi:hypothetical protein